jgi:energy-coupling factor transporter ATP-binding protein EcfA2
MANYSAKRFEVAGNFESDSFINDNSIEFNPFPGLRPFSFDESHLFFGREGQVDEILYKLSINRSVAVLGSSGSGKSSLIYSGLIPALYGGFVTETGPNWNVIQCRPGLSPIDTLSNSIVESLAIGGNLDTVDIQIQKAIISSVLRSSPFGLVEVSKYLQKRSNENVCFLIDLFEEIFRFGRHRGDESRNEASHYVNLVLNAITQEEEPVYEVISKRSDFINECSDYQ